MSDKKKKILFLISSLETGGVSKSITSLLNVIDRKKYVVNLMILSPDGPFSELLPKDLRIISNPVWTALSSRLSGLKYLLKKNPVLAPGHLLRLGLSGISKSKAGILLAKLLPPLNEEFDVIVDFNGQHQLYYMVDKLRAKKKVTFFHSDYSKWPYYYNADKKYFPKVDHIFTISDHCVSVMKKWFPNEAYKIGLMENIVSKELINKMAEDEIEDMNSSLPAILTIGHVCENKGTSMAIETANLLNQKGISFHWYFLGSNENAKYYSDLVNKYGLSDKITFLGIRVNPYPYIKKATIIVHPSKFEGKSIALDEVKLLCKPTVVTNFSTVHDQFMDGYNASISEMDANSLVNKISELLSNSSLREKFTETLRLETKDNSSEINKLYSIFDA